MTMGNKIYFVLFGVLPASLSFAMWQNALSGLWFACTCVCIGVLVEVILDELKRDKG